jgi:hypothetical protein
LGLLRALKTFKDFWKAFTRGVGEFVVEENKLKKHFERIEKPLACLQSQLDRALWFWRYQCNVLGDGPS